MVPTQHIALTLSNGDLYVMAFITEDKRQGWQRPATPENVEAEINKASENWPAKVTGWRYITAADIPDNRAFRAAWTDDGRAIVHDMPKARAIHMDRLRAVRNDRLNASDKELLRAQETGGNTREVLNRRQALRDFPATITPAIEAAETIEALKAIQLPE